MNSIKGLITDLSKPFVQVQQKLKELSLNDTEKPKVNVRRAFKIEIIAGHQFESCGFKLPAYCGLCKDFLYFFDNISSPQGFSLAGLRCKLCELTIHRSCNHKVIQQCTRTESLIDRPLTDIKETHKFNEINLYLTQLLDPKLIYCDHCGYLIVLTQPFYLRCETNRGGCGMIIHKMCKEKICFDCDKKFFDNRSSKTQKQKVCSSQIISSVCKKRLTLDQFEKLGKLGEGSYGKVYKVKWKKNNKIYAMKKVYKCENDLESHKLEWNILYLGRQFPFLASGSCCFQTANQFVYIMEYCPGLNLLDHLKFGRFPETGEEGVRFYSAEIILALKFLHDRYIVYRDLKLENVVIDSQGHSKLIDFGMACRLRPDKGFKTDTICGTQAYLSPEVIEGQLYSFSVDWWALGIVMYELLYGILPFDFKDEKEEEKKIYKIILETAIEYPSSQNRSSNAVSLLNGLLTKNPESRFGFPEVELHPFFVEHRQYFWQDVQVKALTPPLNIEVDDIKFKPGLDKIDESSPGAYEYDNFSQYAGSFKSDHIENKLIDLQ